jgi:hypothetical protein
MWSDAQRGITPFGSLARSGPLRSNRLKGRQLKGHEK